MPRYDNFDLYVSREVSTEFQEGIDNLVAELNLVYVDNCWPSGYYTADEVVTVDDEPALLEDCCECEHCGDFVRRDDAEHSEHLDELYCSSTCLQRAADDHDLVLVEQSHGGPQYVSGSDNEGRLASYCSVNTKGFETSLEHPFLVGCEVEKIDEVYHVEGGHTDILTDALNNNWIAVHDGSLCEDHGFELVSPAYNPTDPNGEYGKAALEATLGRWGALDADTDSRCGGHVTVSHRELTGSELSRRLEPLFPVLYALFPSRVAGEYSRAVRGDLATGTGGKFRAINTLHNRVEFRLFSGVKTGEQLQRRITLLVEALKLTVDDRGKPLMIEEAQDEVRAALSRPESPLSVALDAMTSNHNSDDEREARAARVASFTKWYNTGEIDSITRRYIG